MDNRLHPKDDPRSVDELVNAALMEGDEDDRWNLICTLHWRGSPETFEWAERLCRSECPVERCLGADILAQLGVPDRTFPEQSLAILLSMSERERDLDVLYSILMALSHDESQHVIPVAAKFALHPDSDIRFAVVRAVSGSEDNVAIQLLIQLSADPVATVRDWATFGLGTLQDLDTPEIRDALAARLNDDDHDARSEALVGLAQRGDARVIPALMKALSSDDVWGLDVEAARDVAESELAPLLIALRSWWDVDPDLLEEAIVACEAKRIASS